jgi:hypothetical protein
MSALLGFMTGIFLATIRHFSHDHPATPPQLWSSISFPTWSLLLRLVRRCLLSSPPFVTGLSGCMFDSDVYEM